MINAIVMKFPDACSLSKYVDYKFPGELQHPHGLKSYQVEDVKKMATVYNVANFNRMGYGKTVEAARAMRELQLKTVLVVAPKSVLLQWKDQLDYWYPEMQDSTIVFENGKTPVIPGKIYITNYETFVSEKKLQQFKGFRWDLIVCDEAHKIKNHKSKRTIAVKSIPAERHWVMTGTPILRLVDDLFSILQFLSPKYVTQSYWNFVYYFCEIKEGFFGQEIVGITKDKGRQRVLNTLLDLIAIRRADLHLTPGKNVEIVKLRMEPDQARLYRNAKNLVLDELPEDMTIANGAVLVTRLMQITSCCYDMIGKWGAKFEWIAETIENNPDEQFVIFSRFATTCKLLQQYLSQHKIKSSLYIGDLDTQQRVLSKQDFVKKKSQCLIGTIGALGEGVDGLQEVARNVIFIDRDFSPEINNQAEDRINRIGQKYRVNVYYLNCDKTYDQHVDKVNLKKSEDIRKALKEDD